MGEHRRAEMPAQAYGIPVIFQDLRQEEALLQMFDSLEMLDKTMNDVYEKVATRVTVECGRVARVRQRLAVAKEKLSIIKGNEKATTVFSPAKYPAPLVLEDFVPMYNSINPLCRIVHPDYDLDEVEVSSRGSRKPQEDFDFLRRLTREEPELDRKQGLGRLPPYLPTVSSLLLFNTSENPYKEFRLLDNTQGTEAPAHEQDAPKGPRGDGIKSKHLEELEKERIHKPTWTAIAAPLVFPENLPEIGPIASHDWQHVDLPSIAPSFEASQLAMLPAPPVPSSAPPEPSAVPADVPLPTPPMQQAPVPVPAPAPPPQAPVPDLPKPPTPSPAPVEAPATAPAAPEPEPEPEEPKLPAMPANFLDEIKGFKKTSLSAKKPTESRKPDTGPDMMSRILARGKMMKGEKGQGGADINEKIAMPKPGEKPKPKREPKPVEAPSISDIVLARRTVADSDDEGDWSASDSD